MKAKLLSLFLLACMLITAIPVMASAEEMTGTSFEENLKTDYDDMYVKAGLTSLFLAYENDLANATKSADGVTWKNLVGGKADATFVGSAWAVGANGGIGRTVIYGTRNADGSFTAHNSRNTYWATEKDHKLSLGLDLLPKDDYTLEYVALFPPIYSVDAVTGDLLPMHEIEGAVAPYQDTFVDRIGFMQYFTNHPGGHVENSERGSVRPQAADSGCTGWGGVNGNIYGWGYVNFEFDKRDLDKIASYTVMRDETAFTENEVAHQKAVYYHFLNANTAASTTNGVTYTTVNGKVANGGTNMGTQYFYGDDDTDFYLSYRIGVTYYAIRIYDRNLITSERIWNLGIDVLNFYEIATTDALRADEAQFRRLVEAAAGKAFESDTVAYAATKASLQAKADEITLGTISTDAHDLYVKEGLANVFTTFGEYASTASLSTGKWTDIISGKTASLGSVGHWRVGENGGVGFNIFRCSPADTDGDGYFDACDLNNQTGLNYTNTAIRLDLGLDLLPQGDFTVEYLAKYKPVYMYDANQTDKVARDKNGVKMQVFDYNQTATNTTGVIDIDQIGWFTSYATALDSAGTWDNLTDATRPAYRGSVMWLFNNPSWYYGNNGNALGANYSNAGGLNKVGDAFQQNDKINLYSISLDETLTVAEDGTRTTTGLFSLYRNASFYNSNQSAGNLNSTANNGTATTVGAVKDGGYHDIDTAYTKDQSFRLSMRRPTDFFTVRIYTRALTEAEMLQNRAVDAILYYGLDVSGLDFADEDVMPRLAIALKNASFETDATAKAATKVYLQKIVDTLEGTFAYAAQENLTALFTTYLPGTVDLAGGTWTDIIGGAKASLGTPSAWKMDTYGGVGFNVFYGTANEDGTFNAEGYNLNTYKYYQLNLGIDLLPEDDFTVEYNVRYKPVYVYDADEEDHIAKKDGALLESYVCLGNIPDGAATAGVAVDRFGWFSSWTNNIAGKYWSLGRGGLIWLWHAPAWGGNNNKWVGANWGSTMHIQSNPFTIDNEMHTHGFYVDETRTTEGGTTVVTALVGLYRDVAEYRNNAGELQSTANGGGSVDGGYLDRPFNSEEYFYLSTARPTEFFTIRVYDKALTMDERAHNHFVDLLNHYGVEAPADALRNTDALVALGNTYANMEFAFDAATVAANKATLENAIANLKKTVTITLGDETLDTIEVLGETLALPEVVDGKLAIAWTVSGIAESVLPGTEITVTDGMTLTPVLFALPETSLVPSVKITANEEDLGLRFVAAIWRADYVALAKAYGAENIRYGMLITPDVYVEKAGAFTREALTEMVVREGSSSGDAYIQINATGFYTVSSRVLTIAGTVNNFQSRTLTNNPAFAAIAFLDVDTNGDGVYDLTVYGDYNAAASASVKETLQSATGLTDTQKGWVDSLLSKFGA